MFLAAHRALIDDAYITLDYARTLAQHGQWALEPGHQSNTATSPLNVLFLAGLIVLAGAPVVSAGILLIASLAVTGAALSMSCARLGYSQWPAAVAVSLLVVNPLLISRWSSRGFRRCDDAGPGQVGQRFDLGAEPVAVWSGRGHLVHRVGREQPTAIEVVTPARD